jgi:hypothetical protein
MPAPLRMTGFILLGLGASLLFASRAAAVGGGGVCEPDGSCSAPAPTCAQRTTYGVDNCGNSCSKTFNNSCQAPSPTCEEQTTTGTRICGEDCTKTFKNTCDAPDPLCGQSTSGTYLCGGACTRTAPPCNTWVPYGYIIPGDPLYGFPQVTKADGTLLYKDNNTKDLVGLAAKGNIIIGDYTSPDFEAAVLPNLTGDVANGSKSRPHVIDPSDDVLGYHNFGVDAQGRPRFDGNYDQEDGGLQTDGTTPRKFYQSSLTDDEFRAYLAMPPVDQDFRLDGVLYTNHALAGYVAADDITFNGSLVSRDDAIVFNGDSLTINHDLRLVGDQGAQQVALPYAVTRPRLLSIQDCPPGGC